MRRPSSVPRALLTAALLIVLIGAAAVVFVIVRSNNPARFKPIAGVASDRAATIRAHDGISLGAEVITPRGAGPFPLLVMPGSWGAAASEYRFPGEQFAADGYQVVSYGQRGAKGSGGTADFAGDDSRKDLTTVIDWALAHTHADRSHIGLLGISYGAGISLLEAAHDSRIKAVVAMSGWSSLLGGLAPNSTPNVQSMHSLLDSRLRTGRLAGSLRELALSLTGPPTTTTAVLDSMSPTRSPNAVVAALNRNDPAIMLANAYEDSILDPSPLVPFFNALTTPKRWQLAPGDHGGPEQPALVGKADQTFADAKSWLDHYLRGRANGIDRADPIQLVDGATGVRHGYKTWPSAVPLQLGVPNTARNLLAAGSTGVATATGWSRTLTTGVDSGATAGPFFLFRPVPYHAPRLTTAAVNANAAWIWNGTAAPRPTTVSGSPTVTVTVTSSSPLTTFYAYLYDVAPTGTATLMTYAPDTTASGDVTVSLRPTSWTVRAGDHLLLAVDTVDPRYASAAPAGSTLTLASSAAAPAVLRLPIG